MYDKIKAQTDFSLPRVVFAMGGIGAVMGATSAAAKNISMLKKNEIGKVEAAKSVLKESAGVGLATATATAVIGGAVSSRSSFFSILGFAVVATGTKMLWDKAAYPEKKALPMSKPALKPETDSEEEKSPNKKKK